MWKVILAIPRLLDYLDLIVGVISRLVDKWKSKKEEEEIKDAMGNPDREQASQDLNDIFKK